MAQPVSNPQFVRLRNLFLLGGDGFDSSMSDSPTSATPTLSASASNASFVDDELDDDRTFVFEVTGIGQQTVTDVIATLKTELPTLVAMETVSSEVIKFMGTSVIGEIKKLQSDDVVIRIGQLNNNNK